jgi:hypothetical protein
MGWSALGLHSQPRIALFTSRLAVAVCKTFVEYRRNCWRDKSAFESMCNFEHRASTSSDKMNEYLESNLRQKWETGLNRLWTRPGNWLSDTLTN